MKKQLISASLGVMLLAGNVSAVELYPNLVTDPYRTFGDFQVYSLAFLNAIHGYAPATGPYTIPSASGQIKDNIVIYTGANGVPITTNTNPDNAYPAPSGNNAASYFSTSLSTPADPGGTNEYAGDTANTWDARLSDLKTDLGSNALLFYFNNNESNSNGDPLDASQNIFAWGRVALVDTNGNKPTLYFDLTNNSPNAGLPYGNVGTYTSTNSVVSQPDLLTVNKTDYVEIHGQIKICTNGGQEVLCSAPHDKEYIVNQNLGSDSAAFAVYSPEIQNYINMSDFGGYDVMQLDIRLDNLSAGGEQLFIKGGAPAPPAVPEPSTIVLFGFGMAGMAAFIKRRAKK